MSNLWTFPHEITRKEFEEEYIKITEYNRKDMVKLGRIFYVIEGVYRKPLLQAVFCVFPRLRAGTLVVKGDKSSPKQNYEIFIKEAQDYDDWKNGFDSVITKLISEGRLHVNKKQKLAEFSWK